MKKQKTTRSGFTLVEVGVVLAIIGVLASISIPSVSYFLRQGRAKSVAGSVNSIRNWVGTLQSSGALAGSLPVTEGTKPPTLGGGLIADSSSNVAAAARLDQVLVSSGIIDKLITFGMGSPQATSAGEGSDLLWHAKKRAFYLDDGAGAVSETSNAGRDWSACSRLESRLSSPAVLPSTAQGANFRIDGVTNMSPNTVVAYVHLIDVPYKDAVELARTMNGDESLVAVGQNQETGPVVFALPAAGVSTTDVFIYIAAM